MVSGYTVFNAVFDQQSHQTTVLAQTQQISEGTKFVVQFHQEMRTRAKPGRQHLLRAMFFLYSSAIYAALRLTELNLRVKCVFFLIHRI